MRATTTPALFARPRGVFAAVAAAALALTLVPGSASAQEDAVDVRLKVADAAPVLVEATPRVWPGELLETQGVPVDGNDLVDLVWHELQGPAFAAALELWVAARTDPDLREALAPLQDRIFTTVHRSVTRLAGHDHPRTPMLVQFTIDLLTGSHLGGILHPRAGTSAVVEAWKQALVVLAADDA